MENFQQDQPVLTKEEFIPPKFTPRRAGRLYSWSSVAIQLGATAIYLIAIFILKILVKDGYDIEKGNNILTILSFMTQPILAGFVIGYLIKFKVTLPEVGFRKSKPVSFCMGILLCIGIILFVPLIEGIFQSFLSILGYQPNTNIAQPTVSYTPTMMVLTFIFVAIFPAIFEELIMRGIILESTKGFGTWQACLINGFAFSLFHANPSQCCYTFIMGAVFALVAIRCHSIWPTVIAHFLNNAYSLILEFLNISSFGAGDYILVAIGAVVTALCLVYFIRYNKDGNEKPSIHKPPFFKGATVGIAFNGACWLLVFISYNVYLNLLF